MLFISRQTSFEVIYNHGPSDKNMFNFAESSCACWWYNCWDNQRHSEHQFLGVYIMEPTIKPLIKGAPNPKTWIILVLSSSCLCAIRWYYMLNREWRCSWSSADRWCSNYIWVIAYHDDVIKWKHFPRYWPFMRGIHRSRWIPCTKASDAELWCFLWSAPE